jgi:hypothetical protein
MTPTAKPNPNIIPSANTIKIATTIVRFISGSASAAPARWPRSRLGNLSVSHGLDRPQWHLREQILLPVSARKRALINSGLVAG